MGHRAPMTAHIVLMASLPLAITLRSGNERQSAEVGQTACHSPSMLSLNFAGAWFAPSGFVQYPYGIIFMSCLWLLNLY